MSFSQSKREHIKKYITEQIGTGGKNLASRTMDAFGVSENTVYRYLRELKSEGIIIKTDRGYSLAHKDSLDLVIKRNDSPDEENIYRKNIRPIMEDLAKNIEKIWHYGFSEIMNNAIDHSECKTIRISISKDHLKTAMTIADDGIGIFEKIRKHFDLPALEDACTELFKGKLTTDKKHHSGEGIFFTSRMFDRFAILSSGRMYSYNDIEYIEEIAGISPDKGTLTYFELRNDSKKEIKEIFDRYADIDGGFTRTSIPLKNIYGDYPVSRSQAKRLYNRLDSFEEVILDFDGITDMGQGFAHELFSVFAKAHPKVRLITENTCPDIIRMMNHVKGSTP